MVTHYERLGVSPSASAEEIRDAYRRLARRYHPDTPGGSAAQMAAINEAFRVLRDPGRRALYDAGLRPAAPAPTSAGGAGRRAAEDDDDADFVPMAPAARFAIPLPWLLVLGVLGLIFVFTAYATSSAGRGRGDDVDGVLRAGSCVRLRDGGVAVEVSCTGPNDGKVLAVPPLHSPCPPGGEPYTDQLGLVRVCVRLGG